MWNDKWHARNDRSSIYVIFEKWIRWTVRTVEYIVNGNRIATWSDANEMDSVNGIEYLDERPAAARFVYSFIVSTRFSQYTWWFRGNINARTKYQERNKRRRIKIGW